MTTNDMAAQLAALQATVADLQDQVTYLFGLLGPVQWHHVLKQRKENALAQGTKAPFDRGNFVYRPKDHERPHEVNK
jgi:hypothetical protein